jgi:hypothetical protein
MGIRTVDSFTEMTRTSTATMRANELRLWFVSMAYVRLRA